MVDWIETLKVAAVTVAPFLTGGGVWALLTAKATAKANAPATITASQATLVAALTEQTKTLLTESAKDRRDLKRRIDRQGTLLVKVTAELAEVKVEVAECHNRHADCEINLAEVREQVAKMMRENPPAPTLAINPHTLGDEA